MLDFNEYRKLEENFGGPLGLGYPTSLGMVKSAFGLPPEEVSALDDLKKRLEELKIIHQKRIEELTEAKKKAKVVEDETGDGEVVEPASEKDKPCDCGKKGCKCEMGKKKMACKMAKKKMNGEEEMPPMEDEEEEEVTPPADEESEEDEDVDPQDEEESEEDVPDEDEEESEEEDEDSDVPDDMKPYMKKNLEKPMFAKKKSKKQMRAEALRLEEEDKAWLASVKSMVDFDPSKKYDPGYKEDCLISPEKKKTEEENS